MSSPLFYDAMQDEHRHPLPSDPEVRRELMWLDSEFRGDFHSVYRDLIRGNAVKRIGWIGYWIIRDGELKMYHDNGLPYTHAAKFIFPVLMKTLLEHNWMVMGKVQLYATDFLFSQFLFSQGSAK